jgi:type IV pilus assembly protein PilY1
MKKHFLNCLFVISAIIYSQAALSEDIDLFMGYTPPSTTTDLPNVLLVLDNGANFSANAGSGCIIDGAANSLGNTTGGMEQCALYKLISELEVPASGPKLNIGFMLFNANNIRDINGVHCGGGGALGGCLAVPLMPMTSANKIVMLNWIKSWRTSGGSGAGYVKADGNANGAVMQEAWAYLAGRTGISGRNYSDVKPAAGCARNYVIFVGNAYNNSGKPSDQTGNKGPRTALEGTNSTSGMNADPAATAEQKSPIIRSIKTACESGASFTFPGINQHENGGYFADEWSRYMYATRNVVTYTIGVLNPSACKKEYAALLTSMASVGNGKYYATTDYAGLVIALEQIFTEIQSVNSVFASVSLPASVNTQGTFLNQVFIGMFRPDANANPRWVGNLKQYKLGFLSSDPGNLKLLYDVADNDTSSSNDAAAINPSSGFINPCARSYWTPTSINTYWTNKAQGDCQVGDPIANKASDFPDGQIVEKGAQAYKLRNASSRTLKTCSSTSFAACAGTLTNFDTSNTSLTTTLLGAADTTEKNKLINWARGLNALTDDPIASSDTEMRSDAHGDVTHSRPVAINYSTTDTDPKVVVFYGGNDGVLRAINGNRSNSITISGTTFAPGQELWGFIPPEFYVDPDGAGTQISKLKRIYANTPAVTFPSGVPGTNAKPYGMDGPIVAYQGPVGGTNKVFLYAGMRRGGRALYAFDVTDFSANVPLNSWTVKWKVGCPNMGNDTGCTVDAVDASKNFSGMGQTWSVPSVIKAQGYQGGSPSTYKPILLMGGGYDPCEDFDANTAGGANHDCTSTIKGNKVYVLDADTGAILNILNTERSVIAGLTVVPDNAGIAQYAYTADMGGNIYRINIGTDAPSAWTITKIASLGCDTATCTSGAPNRKFMFAPDVVQVNGINYLLIGSGDREKPLRSYAATRSVNNYFFMVKDSPTDASWLEDTCQIGGADVICLSALAAIPVDQTASEANIDLDAVKGWYLPMTSEEQIVTSAITVSNIVTFSTHQPAVPDASACTSDLGIARVYNIDFRNADSKNQVIGETFAPRYAEVVGGGLAPSPVAGRVKLDDGSEVPFIIGGSSESFLEGGTPSGTTSWTQPRSRVYWYIQQ